MNKLPLVSVIMPIYNTPAEFLREAVRSVLAQTYENWELLAVDDCSTNGAAETVKEFHDSRIKLIVMEKNGGAAAARNRGLKEAGGEFLALLDSDDIARPERLATQVKYLQKHPNIDFVGSWCQMFPRREILKCPTENTKITYSLLFKFNPLAHSTMMLRRKWFDNGCFAYPEGRPAEDYGAWLRLAGQAEFANIAKVLVDYRWHEANLSNVQHSAQVRGSAEFMTERWLELAGMTDYPCRETIIRFVMGDELSAAELAVVEEFCTAFRIGLKNNPAIDFSMASKAFGRLVKRLIRKARPAYRAKISAAGIVRAAGLSLGNLLWLKLRIKWNNKGFCLRNSAGVRPRLHE